MKPLILFLAFLLAAPSLAIADDPAGGDCPIHLHGLTTVALGRDGRGNFIHVYYGGHTP